MSLDCVTMKMSYSHILSKWNENILSGNWEILRHITNVLRIKCPKVTFLKERLSEASGDGCLIGSFFEWGYGKKDMGLNGIKLQKLVLMIKGVQNHSEKVIKAGGNAKWMQLQLWLIFTILFGESFISS